MFDSSFVTEVDKSSLSCYNSTVIEASEAKPTVTIPETEGAGSTVVPTEPPISFPEVTQLRPCSYLECRNGHQWSMLTALAKCGHGTSQGWQGCGNPVLAVKLVNCPFCNEPTTKLKLRIDVTPPIPYPVPLCIPGSVAHAETVFIEVPLKKWRETELAELEKLAKENQKEAQDGQGIQK